MKIKPLLIIDYPLNALLAYPLTTLNNAKIAVIPSVTRIIVGSQLAIVDPKLFTNEVNPVVKDSGIATTPVHNILTSNT